MHDSFFVIGHFHLMLSGVVLVGSFTGFYYYFGALFGIKYSKNEWKSLVNQQKAIPIAEAMAFGPEY